LTDVWAVLAWGERRVWVWTVYDWGAVCQQKKSRNYSTRTEDDLQPVGEFCPQIATVYRPFLSTDTEAVY